jgi:anti-sigma28 factor (negative regulator of flagellin synthesis)
VEIKGISNGQHFSKEISKPKVEQENENPRKDKLEISNEAKLLQTNSAESKKLELIREKIANKFYDSDEVLGKVADKILEDIKNPVK